MRVAVISDTHNRLPTVVVDAIRGAEEIWHLGDVTDERIIAMISGLSRKIRVVRGNCDECTDWPLYSDFEIEGHRIHLEHIPVRQAPEGVDLFLHGHTHVPRDEMVGGTRFLNPGTVGRANKGAPPSYAWLTLNKGEEPIWKVVQFVG